MQPERMTDRVGLRNHVPAAEAVEVDAELERALQRSAAALEERWRSPSVNLAVTAIIAIAIAGAVLPGLPWRTSGRGALAVGLAWGIFELATLAHHALGPRHPRSLWISRLDTFTRYLAPLALIDFGGTGASPLWLVGMVNAFVWSARPVPSLRFEVACIVISHAALGAAFLVAGRVGDAWLAVLVLLASTGGHTMSARMVMRAARTRAERDVIERHLHEASLLQDRERMARELHDGVGADVMALVLRLRRAAERGTHPNAERLAARARALLDELRGVVWSLRNEQGTLAELGKLVDANCRSVLGGSGYARATPAEQGLRPIGPAASLTAIAVARELVRVAAGRAEERQLQLTLTATDALRLRVEGAASSPSDEELAPARSALAAVKGSLTTHAGAAMEATIPIDATSVPAGG